MISTRNYICIAGTICVLCLGICNVAFFGNGSQQALQTIFNSPPAGNRSIIQAVTESTSPVSGHRRQETTDTAPFASKVSLVDIKSVVSRPSSKIETQETKHNPANFDFIVLPYMDTEKERTYIHQIQSLPPVPSGKKFVISFGLYGDDKKYIIGAIRNVELAPTYFPGWEMRFYVDDTVPSDAIKRLKDVGGNIIIRPDNMKDGASIGMFWRFLVSDDESVDRFIVRDSDSRLNARDRFAIEEWIQSDKSTHMARDHVYHSYAMNGGSWGGTKGFLKGKKITSLIEEFMDKPDKIGYGADIEFLMNKIWPIVSNDIMSHDAFYCVKYKGKPFPTKRDDNWQHVGQVFDANDKSVTMQESRNPTECRPADHQDWIYG